MTVPCGYNRAVHPRILLILVLVWAGFAEAKKKRVRTVDPGPQWHEVREPVEAPAEVVGSYAGGCLVGAVPLPAQGVGFETIRRWRNRFYGHPNLAAWLDTFGQRIQAAGLPAVLVGDVSQPRGGRMKNGHRSHQVGLDVDIWFGRPPADRRDQDAHFPSLVDGAREAIDRSVFSPSHVAVLRHAAAAPEVDRIFVNWVIKKELCTLPEGERAWLHKVRPWYGHDSHFHVRLRCPADSPLCRPQSALPKGDGCGEESWFSRAATAERKKARAVVAARPKKGGKPGHTDTSRARCAEVLAAAARPADAVAAAKKKPGHGGAGRATATPK